MLEGSCANPLLSGEVCGQHGWRRIIAEYGSLAATVSAALNRSAINSKLAALGDLVLCYTPHDGEGALGICNGTKAAMLAMPGQGVTFGSMSQARKAWRVGS